MTTTALQIRDANQLAPYSLTREQIDILKTTLCKGATDAELAFFMEVCKAKRLDPFSGQIYAIKRKEKNPKTDEWEEKWTFQVAIDGFRAQAERTGERDGMDPPQWCGEDGEWKSVWLAKEPPRACRVRVYRKGASRPYEAIALWDFYVQTYKDRAGNFQPTTMWRKGGPHMLAKCAEALAWRMAFPVELGDLYAPEEMAGQGGAEPPPTFSPPPPPQLSTGAIIEASGSEAPAATSAKALMAKIAACETLEALTALVPDLAKLPDGPEKDQARQLYGDAKRVLAKAQQDAQAPQEGAA